LVLDPQVRMKEYQIRSLKKEEKHFSKIYPKRCFESLPRNQEDLQPTLATCSQTEPNRRNLQDQNTQQKDQHQNELPIIRLTDIVVDPGTVVIKTGSAPVARAAVFGVLKDMSVA